MKYDVIVVGGGFAGFAAAVASSREGKKTLLIEKFNCLGGAASYDLVSPFMDFWAWTNKEKKEKKILSAGIFSELCERINDMNGFRKQSNITFNVEILKLVMNRMCLESGVELLFNTSVIGAKKADGKLTAVTVYNVSGTYDIEGNFFIDCSGDANLAFMAGYPFRKGREPDHLCQPMTLCFRLSNVDFEKYLAVKSEINPLYAKFKQEGKIRNPRENMLIFTTTDDSILHFNMTRVIKLDPTNADDVTKAEIEAREQVFEAWYFLRDNFEAFKNSDLVSTGFQIGARESRMIDGEVILTKDDLLSFSKKEDAIAVCNYGIDIHSPDGPGTNHYFFPVGEYYSIPYGSLVPKDSINLLVAGRCISTDHEAQASIRIMPTVCTLGEAAGVAACVILDDKSTAKSADIAKIRKKLEEKGAVIR